MNGLQSITFRMNELQSKGGYPLLESRSAQRQPRRMVAAHAVNSSTGRGGRRAEIKIRRRGRVLADTWPKEHLPHRHRSSADVAADQVGIPRLQAGRCRNMPGEHAIPKARSEALDLIFNPLRHIYSRPIRHMAVSPRNVFTRRSARRVEETGL